MGAIENNLFDIRQIDAMGRGGSTIHRLDPRAKLITTLAFIVTVVSFGKYQISALLPFVIYPVVLISAGNLPAGYILKKVLMVAPFAVFIGIFNPLLDRTVIIRFGEFGISGGWVSFASIMLRFFLTVGSALVLIGVTGFNAVCMSLEKLGAPRVFVVQLMFLYRYIFVLMDEAVRMVRARSLRSFGSGGLSIKTYGSLTGHLLLRTLDRAQRIHLAMSCRGFDGHIRLIRTSAFGFRETVFVLGWIGLFIVMRLYNIPELLGEGLMGVFQ